MDIRPIKTKRDYEKALRRYRGAHVSDTGHRQWR